VAGRPGSGSGFGKRSGRAIEQADQASQQLPDKVDISTPVSCRSSASTQIPGMKTISLRHEPALALLADILPGRHSLGIDRSWPR
jgi:hypothetical protein